MTNEQLRMQFIGGIITESEYKQKSEGNKTSKSKKPLKENFVGLGAINNPFPERKKSDYELAFEHYSKDELNEENLEFDEPEEGGGDEMPNSDFEGNKIGRQIYDILDEYLPQLTSNQRFKLYQMILKFTTKDKEEF